MTDASNTEATQDNASQFGVSSGAHFADSNAVEAGPNVFEPAPSQVEVLTEQLKKANEDLDFMHRVRGEQPEQRAYRMREVALHSALSHHRTDNTTACQDATIVNSAKAFYAWLSGDAE